MTTVAALSGASRDIGANHAVSFGNQEFYVQTRVARDGSGMLESEVFHKGRLLLKRRGAACPQDCVEAAEAIRTLQDETEAWLLSKLSLHVGRDKAAPSSGAPPERQILVQRLREFIASRPGLDLAESDRADLLGLVQEIWVSHSARPFLVADSAVALLCARSVLKREHDFDSEALLRHLEVALQGVP